MKTLQESAVWKGVWSADIYWMPDLCQHMPGTVPDTGHPAVNKTDRICLREATLIHSLLSGQYDCFVELPDLLTSQRILHEKQVLVCRQKEKGT